MRNEERVVGWQLMNVVGAWFLGIGAIIGSFNLFVDLFFKDADTGAYDRSQAWSSALFLVVWVTFTWRLIRTGVYAGDEGVRIRTVPRTLTYPWAEITTVEERGDDLWLVLTDGREEKTPVRRGGHRRNGIPLDPGDFNIVLNQLQRHVRPGR